MQLTHSNQKDYRETLAVFMQPDWAESMNVPEGTDPAAVGECKNLPPGVPPLKSRWDASMDYGKFTSSTLAAYY